MLTVIYDGTCRLCSSLARWLRLRAGGRRLRILPNQAPGAPEAFGPTRRDVDQEIW